MAEFYSWFILLSNEKNEPFGLLFFINPSVTSCHLPYILRCKTQRRRLIVTLRSLQCDTPAYGARQGRSLEVALYSFAMNKGRKLYFSNSTPSPCGHSPYIPLRKHRGRRLNTNDFLSLSKKVLVTLIRFICSFFSAARRTNQEAPPRLSGFWVCRRSRRRGLRNSLRSDSPRPFSSVFLATSPPDKGGDLIRAFDGLESI